MNIVHFLEQLENSCCNGIHTRIPFLYVQINRSNQQNPPPPLNKLQTIDLLKDVITSVCERDIFTGMIHMA